MTSRMVFSAMLGAGVLLAPALSPQSAHAADDTKRYAGSGCNTLFSTDLVDRGTLSAILNSSTNATVTVVCPVIRDNTGTGSLGVKKGFVTALDRNAAADQDVVCDVDVRNAVGSLTLALLVRSSGSSATAQKLPFGAVPIPVGGFLSLDCRLPPNTATGKSGVVVYEITEN